MTARQTRGFTVFAVGLAFAALFGSGLRAGTQSAPGRSRQRHLTPRKNAPVARDDKAAGAPQTLPPPAAETGDQKRPRPKLLLALPEPGKLVQKTVDPDLGVTDAWLANGARVHHRFMDSQKGRVYVSVALAGGQIEETAENAGITQAAGVAVSYAATNRLSSAAMSLVTKGRNMQLGASATEDAFSIELSASRDDLEIGLQEIYALMTDGKIEERALARWKRSNVHRLEMFERQVKFDAVRALINLVTGSDPRRMTASRERIEAPSAAAAQAWFDRLCRKAPIEVSIVGDLPWAQAAPLIERYVGSLPQRPRTAEHLKALRHAQSPKGPLTARVEYETPTSQAMVLAGFLTCDGRNYADVRALRLAQWVLDGRMAKRLRDEKKLTSSIRVNYDVGWAYDNSSRLHAIARCTPRTADPLASAIHDLFQEFTRTPPTETELADAKKQLTDFYDSVAASQPTYWWRLLQHFDLHGRNLKEEKEMSQSLRKLTAEKVVAIFKKYYTPQRQYRVIVVPKQAAASKAREP